MEKEGYVQEALMAKSSAGLTFDEIAKAMGLTNVYVAQIFYCQVSLLPLQDTVLVDCSWRQPDVAPPAPHGSTLVPCTQRAREFEVSTTISKRYPLENGTPIALR